MPLNTNGQNACLTGGLGNAITHVSAHSTIPDSNGSSELSGGSYARVAVSWAAAANGARSNSGVLTHAIPAGSTVGAYGLWSALSGGTFYGWVPRTGAGEADHGLAAVDSDGVTANAIQCAGHGLTNGMRVAVTAVLGQSLPTGLSASTLYFVVGATTDTYQLSLSSGGAAVDITGQGELFWQRLVLETFASAGDLEIAIGGLVLRATAVG